MPIPDRPSFDSPDPRWQIRITDDGSPTLVQVASGDSMHSGCGAVAETQHVYLQGSGAEQRLQQGLATRVLEVGLGSGMGWLLTADAAIASGAPLFYLALENRLPPAAVLQRLDLGRFLRCGELLEQYQAWLASLPCRSDGKAPAMMTHRFVYRTAELQLELGDAVQWCCGPQSEAYCGGGKQFDAIYFDPYSPASNPRLWQQDVFTALQQTLSDSGALVSYCVSRKVRDTLARAGLAVNKVPGPPGGKRETLRACRAPQFSRS